MTVSLEYWDNVEVHIGPMVDNPVAMGYGVALMARLAAETQGLNVSEEPCLQFPSVDNAKEVWDRVEVLAQCTK